MLRFHRLRRRRINDIDNNPSNINISGDEGKLEAPRASRRPRRRCYVLLLLPVAIQLIHLLLHQADVPRLKVALGMPPRQPIMSDAEYSTVRIHQSWEEFSLRMKNRTEVDASWKLADSTRQTRLWTFDEVGGPDSLSREWDIVHNSGRIGGMGEPGSSRIVGSARSNVCFSTTQGLLRQSSGSVHCLPSFLVIGFEKCSTTELSFWLSHHPNLQSHWLEGRYFNHIDPTEDDSQGGGSDLDRTWYDPYLIKEIPPLTRGVKDIGYVWTFEKSPGIAPSDNAPEAMARLVPTATLIFAIRNPTLRVYSMVQMYFAHYPTVSSVFRAPKGMSYFVKEEGGSGAVRFVNDKRLGFYIGPGHGGRRVPPNRLPPNRKSETWRFLQYPPDPHDFDAYVRYAMGDSRTDGFSHRILFSYASHLRRWLQYFPRDQIVLVPNELFYTKDVLFSMEKLQETLGLPLYDYSNIKWIRKNGRVDIISPASWANGILNSHPGAPEMLNETRKLLDDFFCEENIKLSHLLGGRSLPGYSCIEDD